VVETWTTERAERLIGGVVELFHAVDVDGLVEGFTPDVVFRFGEQPEQKGRDALRALLSARLARQEGYRLTKVNRAVTGNRLTNTWEGTWTDRATGTAMAGFGVEFWDMRGELIERWEAAFNVWEAHGPRRSPVM
jgi:nuclear transport factor 2 (NTF2) superfamily protein